MRSGWFLSGAVAVALISNVAVAALPMQPVIIGGETIPGTPTVFSSAFEAPRINGHGEVAFSSFLPSNTMAILSGSRSALSIVAKRWDTAPGTDGLFYNNLNITAFSDVGEVEFRGDVQWTTGVNQFNDEFSW